jgi:hypothetical protein
MGDNVTPERVVILAAAARVPISDGAASRIAKAVAPTIARMSAQNIQLQLEIEPSTFVAVARKGANR